MTRGNGTGPNLANVSRDTMLNFPHLTAQKLTTSATKENCLYTHDMTHIT